MSNPVISASSVTVAPASRPVRIRASFAIIFLAFLPEPQKLFRDIPNIVSTAAMISSGSNGCWSFFSDPLVFRTVSPACGWHHPRTPESLKYLSLPKDKVPRHRLARAPHIRRNVAGPTLFRLPNSLNTGSTSTMPGGSSPRYAR